MPELPEVETVRSGLEASLLGARIEKVLLHRADLRTPITEHFITKVKAARIIAIRRRAKYLLIDLDQGQTVLAHLGMSGRMVVREGLPAQRDKHDHAQFMFDHGLSLTFNDARRFGILEVWPSDRIDTLPAIASLGPEPFDRAFSPRYLSEALARRTTPVKVALMDQALVVGVGNIYASEAFFLCKLSPLTRACDAARFAPKLVPAIRRVLKDAIASGGSTLRDYVRSSGDSGHFQHRFNVYGRAGKPCPACHTSIEAIRQAGRTTFFCPNCQRRSNRVRPAKMSTRNAREN